MAGVTSMDLGPFPDADGYEEAAARDAADPLRQFRDRYVHNDPDLIYLDGNSLGRLPLATADLVEEVTRDQWGDRLIRSWNEGWWELQLRLGDKLAPLIGARSGEVIISDSTSVNLYKLAEATLSSASEGRRGIVTDDLNFPSDVYILDGVARRHGGQVRIVSSNGRHGPIDGLRDAIDESTALVSLSHTAFKSGFTYDMAEVTAMAHDAGAMVLWDCSHSVGAVPIDVGGSAVDLAIGCTYKYLNGGPGSPAFLYVRGEHQDRLHNPIAGWWGHESPFEFDLSFSPVSGIRRFHSGTMPTLSLAAIEPGLDDVLEAGIDSIRSKSVALSTYLIELSEERLAPLGFEIASPTDPAQRGSHVSLAHPNAWGVARAMVDEAKVIPDFRTPDNVRLGLAPLYVGFVDVHTAVGRIERLVMDGAQFRHTEDSAEVT
jgi:kynureninase